MKWIIISIVLATAFALPLTAQNVLTWSETDRKYLVDNMVRSQEEIRKETANLSKAQWTFKESPDRWSIADVIEHIALWELLLQRDISLALGAGPQPEFSESVEPDSLSLNFIMEEKKHISVDYNKPFTFTLPTGFHEGTASLSWLNKLRNESVEYIKTTKEDLRAYYRKKGWGNVHQIYIITFGHMDRHLRQIKKVKQHKDYPRK